LLSAHPLTAMACTKVLERALERFGDAPEGLVQLVIGGPEIGDALVSSPDVAIVSATGSTRMGAIAGPNVAARWGRPILELGGNNAMIVAPSADLEMAVRAIVFSAVGTAGQRCTSLRRLIVHNSIKVELVAKLVAVSKSLRIGDPREAGTLIGSLIDHAAARRMQEMLNAAASEGGTVHGGGACGNAVGDGAFGGEKETGGGRESGSDAWKSYMRRQTNTINYSAELPLAQGVKFDI